MPVTVVIGGQYGSEGKGKVAHFLAKDQGASAAVRIGGSNSGHTSVSDAGTREILRQLPTAALLDDVICVLGPGSYVDPKIVCDEIDRLALTRDRVCIDYRAMVMEPSDADRERRDRLGDRIGSTCSGTGAAVTRRIARRSAADLAFAHPDLEPYVGDSVALLRELLDAGKRVVLEGTQGFGLSLLHSPHFPYVTSRDTSASGAVAEAGLSPRDVEDIVLVLRSFPIRVAGDSGPFDAEEIDWEMIRQEAGLDQAPREFTSVTRRLRRVARFDPGIVRRAIQVNRPSRIVLNHLDYVDARFADRVYTAKVASFVDAVRREIGQSVDLLGLGPNPGDLIPSEHPVATPV